MKYTIAFLFLITSFYNMLTAQFIGTVSEDYTYSVKPIKNLPASSRDNNVVEQIEGYPKSFLANSNFKNFRNVSLEDINGDGLSDIIFAANKTLYAYSNHTLLWEKPLIGIGLYPPSIADLDGDGQVEIVQVTGGQNEDGSVYVLDINGKDLEGWPKTFDNNWIITAPTLSDIDADGIKEIVFLERVSSTLGYIHIQKMNGASYSDDWPVAIPGTPAVTPSLGDVDNDGAIDILVCSSSSMYLFDLKGDIKPGWPVEDPNTRFSFQSPILVDLNNDGTLEIVGAAHGEIPEFYIRQFDGSPYKSWPFVIPERAWSFCSPTVVEIDGAYEIFMSRPISSDSDNNGMLYSWNDAGRLNAGFPIENFGGLTAGIISIANIDDEPDYELIFGSNMIDADGNGFIHAFKMDGSGELDGFPILTKGWTLSNGIAIDDVNGDGKMDLVALGYSLNFGAKSDSIFVNVFPLDQTYEPEKVLWSTFKGNNAREGTVQRATAITSILDLNLPNVLLQIHPNPVHKSGIITIHLEQQTRLKAVLFNSVTGAYIKDLFEEDLTKGTHTKKLPTLPNGNYLLYLANEQNQMMSRQFIVVDN